jgi:hypothetical protein
MISSWLGLKALRSASAWLGLGGKSKSVSLGSKEGGSNTASPETELNARFADEAYNKPDERRDRIGDYYYDRSISNDENAIYINKKGRVIHSLRGTELNRGIGTLARDLIADLRIATGTFENSDRHKRDVKKADEVRSKYGNNTFYVGHSLAGKGSQALANKYNTGSQTFNAGQGLISSQEIAVAKSCKKDPSQPRCNQVHSRIKGDLVSLLPTLSGRTEIIDRPNISGALGKHEISNFYNSSLPTPKSLPAPITKVPRYRSRGGRF